jgi:hypothetical protein
LLICAKHLFVAAIGDSSGQQAQPQAQWSEYFFCRGAAAGEGNR